MSNLLHCQRPSRGAVSTGKKRKFRSKPSVLCIHYATVTPGYLGRWLWELCLGQREFSSPLDVLEKQTDNKAELKAAISEVVKLTYTTIIFRDSKYVLDGVQGNVCPVRAQRATFLLTIPTSAPDLPSHEEAPQVDQVALHTFPTKHVA